MWIGKSLHSRLTHIFGENEFPIRPWNCGGSHSYSGNLHFMQVGILVCNILWKKDGREMMMIDSALLQTWKEEGKSIQVISSTEHLSLMSFVWVIIIQSQWMGFTFSLVTTESRADSLVRNTGKEQMKHATVLLWIESMSFGSRFHWGSLSLDCLQWLTSE